METDDLNLDEINLLFNSANGTKLKMSEKNRILIQVCGHYYGYITKNCGENINKSIELYKPNIETNIDTTPENFSICTSELNRANTKLQTCLDSNQEIIRESNNATRMQEFEIEKLNSADYQLLLNEFNRLQNMYKEVYEQYKNELEQYINKIREMEIDNEALEIQNSNYRTQNLELRNEYDNGKESNKTLVEENLGLRQFIETQINEINKLKTYCSDFNNQNNLTSEQIANNTSLKELQLLECEVENERLQNAISIYQQNYTTMLRNHDFIINDNNKVNADDKFTTDSISQILDKIKRTNNLIAQQQNSNKAPDQIKYLPSQPYELKMYLYNTVTHALFNVNELVKSVRYYGKNNIQYALRNRRFDGAAYKNSLRIYSDESINNLLKYDQMSKYLEDNL